MRPFAVLRRSLLPLGAALAAAAFLVAPLGAQAGGGNRSAFERLARDIYRELIEINTTDSPEGDNTRAAEAMAARLRAAGLPAADVQVLAPAPRKGNLVARLRGSGARRPLLLLAHLDVVAARRDDWSLDPFTFTERDGFFYGRGTADDKAMAAIFVAMLVRFRQEGYVPDRDIIVALTADEEGGQHNGVEWLLANHRPLLDAAYAINEGGGGYLRDGKPFMHRVQAAEKRYADFTLTARNKGGHSSVPVRPNAIYQLAEALGRIGRFDFPVRLNPVTVAWLERTATIESPEVAAAMRRLAADARDTSAAAIVARTPAYNSTIRTTCVATLLNGGHAPNALPQTATANVNCRIAPGETPETVRAVLQRVVADTAVQVGPGEGGGASDPSPLDREVMEPVERLTREMWPGIPVVPVMSTGATDGRHLRAAGIPTYGVSGLFGDMNDSRAHGRDERMGVPQFYDGLTFLDRLVRALSARRPMS